MEFDPLQYNDRFLRDGEQQELGLIPFEDPPVTVVPGVIRIGRKVKIGRKVQFKPHNT